MAMTGAEARLLRLILKALVFPCWSVAARVPVPVTRLQYVRLSPGLLQVEGAHGLDKGTQVRQLQSRS